MSLSNWERIMKQNMATAERDLKKHEDRRGFIIGAVARLWDEYQARNMTEQQFDHLMTVLEGFSNGAYRALIQGMVRDYKRGQPPTIIGY
jgi:hypothetical protein